MRPTREQSAATTLPTPTKEKHMRLARKLFLLAAMAITALALTATAANAQVEVIEEDGIHCPPVSLSPTGHNVTGGCDIEYRSERHIPLVAYVPNPVVVSNCRVHLSALVGENGAGYVTAALLSDEVPPANPACTRFPCDENGPVGSSKMIPWPLQIEENGPGLESIEATFCLRTIASGEGGAPTQCQVHLPLTQNVGTHDHEIGGANLEVFCEVAPMFPTSIRNAHFLNEVPAAQSTEDIEVIH
jgi:hypothetical protein